MSVEERVAAFLSERNIEHELVEIDPELADTALFCVRYGYAAEDSANAILVASKKEPKNYAVGVVLATTRLDVNKAMREQMGGKRVSFATADEMRALTGMEVGGLTPFALPPDLSVIADARVMQRDKIIVGGGGRRTKLIVSPTALQQLPHFCVVDDLAKPIG